VRHTRPSTFLPFAVLPVAFLIAVTVRSTASSNYRGWPAYGGGPEQMRYSGLTQINRNNVAKLEVAWTYDTKETGGLQTQPIVVDGVLFGYTPTHKTFAVRAATGEPLWTFDPKIVGRGPNRGLMYWASGDDRRVFAAVDAYVYALNATAGEPIATFGDGGRIDLRNDLGRDPSKQNVRLTSPGVVYKDLFIVGGRESEGLPGSPGDVRAYDVRTGKLRWSFHTIPHPGEPEYDTWGKDSWKVNGSANNWTGMALDQARGIVYVPTGSASSDFYGANRPGDNVYANSLIALKADTGERIWHFQGVRHDIWDRDFPSPPTLATIEHDGRTIDAVVQTSKHGFVFVFDRTNGKPVFPIEYRKFPKSDLAGEVTADTQPIPTKPKPFARQQLTRDMLTTRTPEAHQWALEKFATFRGGGLFVPLAVNHDTVVFPGFDGGAEWGGSALDPETGVLYVNANDLAWTGAMAENTTGKSSKALYLQNCAACHKDDRTGAPPQIPSLVDVASRKSRQEMMTIVQRGAGRMPGFPNLDRRATAAVLDYVTRNLDTPVPAPSATEENLRYRFTGYNRFVDPDGYPAVAPPWGTLNAIDLNTGEYVWKIPLGEYPELAEKGLTNTGTENYGGPAVTAGGLLFIGATNYDRKFRAFDKSTGQLLWETTLPFSGNATPAVFEVDGREFVVIGAGGGKGWPNSPTGGVYVAFALPR
jgi:quinoprotein glucose dehydrogenase